MAGIRMKVGVDFQNLENTSTATELVPGLDVWQMTLYLEYL